ncbi:unnamed protein product, partial [Mesorhabditis belari]|uniref:Uncharacterized protein n=1 Tax=Mesorhabditis belari TaxID=2138241 RepID=A0AAF3EPJ4_9BILA
MEKVFRELYKPTEKDIELLNDFCSEIHYNTEMTIDPRASSEPILLKIFPYAVHFPVDFQPSCSYQDAFPFYESLKDPNIENFKNPKNFPRLTPEKSRPEFSLLLQEEEHPFVFLPSGVAVRLGINNVNFWRGEMPAERNPFNLRLGDVVWAPWPRKGKKEYWAAYIFNFQLLDVDRDGHSKTLLSQTKTVQGHDNVVCAWLSEHGQYLYSLVPYREIRPFDTAFHIRYEAKEKKEKWCKNVAQGIVATGKLGYWEDLISTRVLSYLEKMPQAKPLLNALPKEVFDSIKSGNRTSFPSKKGNQSEQQKRLLNDKLLYRCYEVAFEGRFGYQPDIFDNIDCGQKFVHDLSLVVTTTVLLGDLSIRPPLFIQIPKRLKGNDEELLKYLHALKSDPPPDADVKLYPAYPWLHTTPIDSKPDEHCCLTASPVHLCKYEETLVEEKEMRKTEDTLEKASLSQADWLLERLTLKRTHQILSSPQWPPPPTGSARLLQLHLKPSWFKLFDPF